MTASQKSMHHIASRQTDDKVTDRRIDFCSESPSIPLAKRQYRLERQWRVCATIAPVGQQHRRPTQWQHLSRLLPLPSNSLFLRQVRHDVSRPVLQHSVDDVDQTAYDAHQRLFLGFAVLDFSMVVVVEYGVAGTARYLGHLHLLMAKKGENGVLTYFGGNFKYVSS